MSRLLVRLFVAILALLALYMLLSRLGIIPSLGVAQKAMPEDQRHFGFASNSAGSDRGAAEKGHV